MEKEAIWRRIRELGVDIAGFSDASLLADAPKGFAPPDVLHGCRRVIAFAIRFPRGALHSPTPHIYTRIQNTISDSLCVAIPTAVHIDAGIGMMAGMAPGLLVGSGIEKA